MAKVRRSASVELRVYAAFMPLAQCVRTSSHSSRCAKSASMPRRACTSRTMRMKVSMFSKSSFTSPPPSEMSLRTPFLSVEMRVFVHPLICDLRASLRWRLMISWSRERLPTNLSVTPPSMWSHVPSGVRMPPWMMQPPSTSSRRP